MKQELAGNREGVPTSGNRRATEESPGFSRGEGANGTTMATLANAITDSPVWSTMADPCHGDDLIGHGC